MDRACTYKSKSGPIRTVYLKPGPVYALGPCALAEGTAEYEGGKKSPLRIELHDRAHAHMTYIYDIDGEIRDEPMNYRGSATRRMGNQARAALALIATIGLGFGYAKGAIPGGVHAHLNRYVPFSQSRKGSCSVSVQCYIFDQAGHAGAAA